MKTLTTMTAALALIAGMSIASAQNTATPAPAGAASPSNLNAGSAKGGEKQSGMETNAGAQVKGSATTQSNMPQAATQNPGSPNTKPLDSGSASASGSQSTGTTGMSGGSTGAATSGTATSTTNAGSKTFEPSKSTGK